MLRALIVRLDGQEVGRVGAGKSIEVRGSGADQVLTLHMDWMASSPVTVRDPAPGVLDVEVGMPAAFAGFIRTFVKPRSAIAVHLPG